MSHSKVLLFFLTTFVICTAGEEHSNRGDWHFEITSGGSISVEDVEVYTDEDFILFSIPALPSAPNLSKLTTCNGPYCPLVYETVDVIRHVYQLHHVLEKVYSRGGLEARSINTSSTARKIKFDEVNYNKALLNAGDDWLKQVESVFAHPDLSKRQKRMVLAPAAMKLAPLLGPTIYDSLKNLISDKGTILKSLVKSKALSSSKYSPFLKVANTISEFATTEVENEGWLNKIIPLLKDKFYRIYHNASHAKEAERLITKAVVNLLEIQNMAAYATHWSAPFSAHSQATTACRANELPLLFVSPKQLTQKLNQLESELPGNLELVWNSDDVMRYYKSDSTECTFFDGGGLLSLSIPLREKNTRFKLYRFQGISFKKRNVTCNLELPTMHVAVDETNNLIYPISDLDAEFCTTKGRKCRVPLINAVESPQQMCVAAILRQATVAELDKVCEMKCKPVSSMQPVQTSKDTVVVANLPKAGAEVKCGNITKYLTHSIEIGAIKIKLNCNCELRYKGKLIAESRSKFCNSAFEESFLVTVLIPAQWTTLEQWRARPHDSTQGMTFRTVENILKEEPIPQSKTFAEKIVNEYDKTSWFTTCWQFLNSILTAVLVFRQRGVAGTVAVLAARIGEARANKSHSVTCVMPIYLEIVIYAILVLLILVIVPPILKTCCKKVGDNWNRAVEIAAERRATQEL